MKHYDTKFKYVGVLIGIIGGMLLLILKIAGDNAVIYLGIRLLSVLHTLGVIILLAGSIPGIVLYILDAVRNAVQQKNMQEQQAQAEITKKERTTLNKGGRLSPPEIRARFQENARIWHDALVNSSIQDEFDTIFNQIDKQFDLMDKDQDKLKRLLDTNGADALRDTENILDKVEQLMCRRVLAFINWMDVYSASSKDDCSSLYKAGKDCYKSNETLLSSSKDFMLSIAKYLNSQDETDNLDELGLYKQALLQEINSPEV